LTEDLDKWKDKKILIIGEALIDKYILGMADRISPDAPVPNVKINKTETYLGAIGLVLQYIKSLGGKPEICTIVGDDFEGDFFVKKIKQLNVDPSNIIIAEEINTPQITRIKAMDQHLLRLETDYKAEIPQNYINELFSIIKSNFNDLDSIIILDYGAGGLFTDSFVQELLNILKTNYHDIPVLVRPSDQDYFLYENVDLMKINLKRALNLFSIDCYTETSINIVGKRILSASKCKNLLLNYLETNSFLFLKNQEKVEKFDPVLDEPARSFIAVGSVIMAIMGLSFAAKLDLLKSVQTALHAGVLSAINPPVKFFDMKELKEFINKRLKNK